MVHSLDLAYFEEIDYWAQSLIILFDKAKEIRESTINKFMKQMVKENLLLKF